MQSVQGNSYSILKCVLLLHLVSYAYSSNCNSTHINYCNRVNRPSSYSYTVYESVQQTYTETYYYKCGFRDWYTCTGNRSRNYSTLVPVTETVYFNTTLRECCITEATCNDEEMFDLRYIYRFPGYSSTGYDIGIIQICLEGYWRYIDYAYDYNYGLLCNNIKRYYNSYSAPTSGTDRFVRISFKSGETNIRYIDYTHYSSGTYYYLHCQSSYFCTDGCAGNGACTDREKCTCNSGYTGKNCDIVTCAPCVYGQCTGPNSCSCHTGWSGSDCNTAVCSQGCVNGMCVLPDACKCNPGYTGDTCNIPVSDFIEHPVPSLNSTAGKMITLSCSVIETESTNQLKWIFVRNTTETELSASSNNIDISNSINGAGAVSVSNLTISDIDLSNAGTYACLHRHTYSSTTHVDIEYPVNVTVYPDTIIAPTSVVEQIFICKGYGYPLPELEWMREDEFSSEDLLNDDNYTIIERTEVSPLGYKIAVSELIITYYDNTTIGNYICQGYNNVTNLIEAVDEATVSFYLEEPPMVTLNLPPTVVMLVNESINISFTVYLGLPEAVNITWTFQQMNDSLPVVLQSTSTVQISDDLFSVFITSLDYKHEGVYTLTLCNRAECSYNSIELIVDAPPTISTVVSSDMGVVSPANVSINCVASIGKPVPLVQWIFNDRIIGMGYGSNNITFNVTSFEDGGRYTCTAENIHGITNKSLTITVQDIPMFYDNPLDEEALIGGYIELSCITSGYPVPDILWIKDGIVLTIGNDSMKFNFSIEQISETDSTALLYIADLNKNDTGYYSCQANNSLVEDLSVVSASGYLDVLYPPNVDQELFDVTKVVNETVKFFCNFTGNPLPIVQWEKDGLDLDIVGDLENRTVYISTRNISNFTVESTLTLENLTKEDEGNYTCVGINRISGILESNDISTGFLTILVPPYLIDTPHSSTAAPVGDNITLECVVGGFPLPNITWIRIDPQDGSSLILLEANEDGEINETYDQTFASSSIQLSNLQLNDTAIYRCIATNILGNITHDTHLTVQFPANVTLYPEVLIAPEINITNSFTCTAYGIPLPTLTWYSINGELGLENVTITITNETLSTGIQVVISVLTFHEFTNVTEGFYGCTGYNNVTDYIGVNSSALGEFILATKPLIDSNYSNYTGIEEDSITLEFEIVYAAPVVEYKDIYWTFTSQSESVIMDWEELNADERIEFSEDRLNMTIYNLTYNDAGIFNITATNREGIGYTLIELIIEGEPNIDYVSADKEVVSPTTELIECVTSGNPDPIVEWVFQNETLNSSNSSSTMYFNNRTIDISSVRDAGVYCCVASNGYGKVSLCLNITVQDPSVIVMNPNDTNGTVSGSVTLSCTAYGYPIPQIQWLKNGSLIVTDIALEANITSSGDHEEGSGSIKYIVWSNSTIGGIYEITSYLTIVNLSHTDRGQYQCMASNSLVIDTVNTSLSATVDVMYPPNVFQPLVNVTVNTSDNLSLICSISGHPIPNITWWFKQQDNIEYRIELSDRIRAESMECVQYSSYDECQQSLLTVVNVSKSDTGTYTCRGANEIPDINGVYTNFTSAYVFVQVPPIVMLASEPIVRAVVGHNEYVLINFTISDDIPSVQPNKTMWYKTNATGTFELPFGDRKHTFSHDRTLLNITNLQYTDRGNYTMVALNEAGVDEATITLYLEVEPLLLNSTGAEVDIIIPGNITNVYFNCSADGIPVPVLQWYKDGSLLLNTSRYLITYTTNNITDTIRSDVIPEIQLAHSSLNLSKLRETDNGTYECRADNSAGETKIVSFHLNVTDNYVPVCNRPELDICNIKMKKGETCIDTGRDKFFCECNQGYTGTTCDTKIVIEVAAILTKIESSIGNGVGEVVTPPTDVAGFLFQPLTLTCHAAGIPIPKVIWRSRNESFMVNGSSLTFEEMRLSDRGFYKCEVSNKLNSEVSEEIRVYIANIYQYRVRFNIAGLQSNDALSSLRQALTGSVFPDKQTQFLSIDRIPPGNTNKRNTVSDISTMVTIQSKENGSDALASALLDHIFTRLEQKAVLVKPYNELPDRFDGCKSENTLVPSVSNKDLDFNITWPEINLGESITLPCPCGGLDLQSSALVATRMCGGNYTAGAEWEEPNIQPCSNFSDSVRRLCQLATQEPVTRVNSLGNLTENSSEFQKTEITVSVAVLLSAIANVTGERMPTESFLSVINNLLGSSETAQNDSQATANTSGRLLEALEMVASGLSNYTDEDIVLPFDSFAVLIKAFNNTTPPSTYAIKAFNNGSDNTICTTEQQLCQSQQNPSAEVTLPPQVFDYFDNNSSTRGVTSVVYVNDALFLRRDKMHHEVSSVIISVSVVGAADSITGLESPVVLVFQMNPSSILENASDPICSFWDPTLDDKYGDWSSVGCELVSIDNITNSSDDVLFTCHCNHLTSFTVLMDVSYEEVEPPKTHFDFVLSAYTFIGCIISTVCLIVAAISHLANKKLRRSEHGLLVVNLSLSLIGVYGTFIGAVYAIHIPVVCIVVAALIQYFFLVAFLIMTVEAIELYRKTVRVFVSKQTMEEFTVKIFISCWVLPLIIVGFCLAPDYDYYISKKGPLCRAQQIPFYIGTIVPFFIIYIFNWIMFVLIFVSIMKRSIGVANNASTKVEARLKVIKYRLRTAVVLSVIFGLGWGLGLPATQAQENDILRYVFSIGFNTLTAFQGTMLFFLHCVNSKEVRKEWKQWFSVIFKKKGIVNTSFSNPSQQKNFKAEFQESNTNLTSVSRPSSTLAIAMKTRSSVSPSEYNSTDSPTPSRDIMLSPTRLMRNSLPYSTQNGSNFELTVVENKFQ